VSQADGLDEHACPSARGEHSAVTISRGIIRLGLFDFLQQLTTFRAQGPTPAASFEALTRFGILFMGKLRDVYGRPSPRRRQSVRCS
jgi:cholesterol oxidase